MSTFLEHPSTRREFLHLAGRGIGLLAFSRVAPAFLTESVRASTPTPETDRPILVLIQLAGGNDGLNTVVPYADDRYRQLRPTLALPVKNLHLLDDERAFHPECAAMARLAKEGQLCIVQNVGYPNPNRSHFRSMEIWETASDATEYKSTGWIGRFFDHCCSGEPAEGPVGLELGGEMPDTFLAEHNHHLFAVGTQGRERASIGDSFRQSLETWPAVPDEDNLHYLRHTLLHSLVSEKKIMRILQQYRPQSEYPTAEFSQRLRSVAALIAARQPTRVYFVSLGGFDTHANQLPRHGQLLRQLSEGLAAFQQDLQAHGLQDQVLTMTFSEFGRRPSENASDGTDHGTAAPLFLMGSQLATPVYGPSPDLTVKANQDLRHTIDFRDVYSTIIEKWFDQDPAKVLGSRRKPLALFAESRKIARA